MDISSAIKLIDVFFSAFYHEQDDVRGTTRALAAIKATPEYRQDLARAFRLLLEGSLDPGLLTNLVREAANRNVQNDEEASAYLEFIFNDTLLNYELDDE